MQIIRTLLLFYIVIAILGGCAQNRQAEFDSKSFASFDSLVWSDEFDGEGALDSAKWFHQTQLPPWGEWFGGLINHYTDRVENAYQKDGYLNLVAKRETFEDQGKTKEFTSARLNSKFAFTYGRLEVRAKMPEGVGTWPAIWMLSKNISEAGAYWEIQGYGTTSWPHCGEIDILEHWGRNQDFVQSAVHNTSSYGEEVVNHGGRKIENASSEFHTYTMVWSEESIVFSVDGIETYTYRPEKRNKETWPYDSDQYILMNIAIERDIERDFKESIMVVDYIRVYQ